MKRFHLVLLGLFAAALTGCTGSSDTGPVAPSKAAAPASDEVRAVRAKLAPDERALVEAQEWCVVQTDERLGSMGAPIRLDIKGQPVFVCCKSCQRKAELDPDATLAKAAEVKTKAKAEKKQ